jgi:hypothetical protein
VQVSARVAGHSSSGQLQRRGYRWLSSLSFPAIKVASACHSELTFPTQNWHLAPIIYEHLLHRKHLIKTLNPETFQSLAKRKRAPFVGDDEFVAHLFKMLALEKIEVRIDFLPALQGEENTPK